MSYVCSSGEILSERKIVAVVCVLILTGVSVVEVAGCWRDWGQGSSGAARWEAGAGAGVGAAVGVRGRVGAGGEVGAAVWVTALLWTSPASPLVTWGSCWLNVALSFWGEFSKAKTISNPMCQSLETKSELYSVKHRHTVQLRGYTDSWLYKPGFWRRISNLIPLADRLCMTIICHWYYFFFHTLKKKKTGPCLD